MKDYEKAIKEEGLNFATRDGHFTINPLNEAGIRATIKGFKAGAKSQAAKEFHQQGMYSEEQLKDFASYVLKLANNVIRKKTRMVPLNEETGPILINDLFKEWSEEPTETAECPIGSYEAENKVADCAGDSRCDLCQTCINYVK